jgi:hypothetical protein
MVELDDEAAARELLRSLAHDISFSPLDDTSFAPLPLADQTLEDDEHVLHLRWKVSYECQAARWEPIRCSGVPINPPRRFIDGSIFSRTVGLLRFAGKARPAVLASVGALALELNGTTLFRPANGLRLECVLSLISNDVPLEALYGLEKGLKGLGIRLVHATTHQMAVDFEMLRRRTFDMAKDKMEEAERELLLVAQDTPALVDGLLERRLTTVQSQQMCAYGLVKRQMKHYLPESYYGLLYDLKPGERTPAFVVETKNANLASWYLRLSRPDATSPSYGLVRMTTPLECLERNFPAEEDRWREISAVSAFIQSLRHRESSYSRVGISVEPIVRVEDELHALLPDVRQMAARLHRALGS